MKKIALILLVAGMASCKKQGTANEAYCVYSNHQFISCEKSSSDAQNKCIQLRNSGQTNTESVKKSKCDEC